MRLHIALTVIPVLSIFNIFASFSRTILILTSLPGFRPSLTPSIFFNANASLVRIEIRFLSISATSPKAKQSTLLLMVLSTEIPEYNHVVMVKL